MKVAVVNLSGMLHLDVERSPFPVADEMLEQLKGSADAVIVDFHAELTSEKVAMGWHLDGRVAAVLGTHTHVPTADARVLPGGTAHITDVGMTGPARQRHRRQAGAGARAVHDADAGAVRDRGGERLGDGRARRRRRRRARPGDHPGDGSGSVSVARGASSATNRNGRNQGM